MRHKQILSHAHLPLKLIKAFPNSSFTGLLGKLHPNQHQQKKTTLYQAKSGSKPRRKLAQITENYLQ